MPTDTERSFNPRVGGVGLDLNRITNMTKTTALSDFISSRVELEKKQVIGKNPPPKLNGNRQRAVPSIPSSSIAPPEDKTMMQTL